MKKLVLNLAVAFVLACGAAHAAGFNLVMPDGTPLKWDTTGGPIPVYTDGGGAFTYDFEGVTPFITIERANEIVQFAYDQWSNVPTSTFEANVVGSIDSAIGIADVTDANVDQIVYNQNGYGIWVVYDTDAAIMENFFGVSRYAVLGIAFPEIALPDGTIVEATAILNGWYVDSSDTNGEMVAGVFTHEFGHTINLSHTQVNGHLANYSYPSSPLYPGVEGCGVDPVHRWTYSPPTYNPADPYQIETMYPFIGHRDETGRAMSYVSMPDDIAAISGLYPTADYLASTGSISGTLRLKDGTTDYTGINIVARNVNDLTGDAVSAMTGHQTLGTAGPDGSFTIRGLTPGEEYVVYTEQIYSGGFPTGANRLISVAEYWNAAEGTDPITDDPCDATPILAEAGVIKTADLYFNGYIKGIDFTPIGAFHLTDLAKDGKSALGQAGSTPFVWDEKKGFDVIEGATVNTGSMSKDGQKIAVNADTDGDGIGEGVIWNAKKGFTSLGYLGDGQCGGSSQAGVNNASPWAMSDDGKTVVGLAYIDRDGNGFCQSQRVDPPEINGFVWTARTGMQELSIEGLGRTPSFVRAHAISGNGDVILGGSSGSQALAWVDGEVIDLYSAVGATDAYAINYDGTRAAMLTRSGRFYSVKLWDHTQPGDDAFEDIGGLAWCVDLDFFHFFLGNLCTHPAYGPARLQQLLGPIPVLPTDMTDDGKIIVGRAGSFTTGFVGAIWMEPIGWMNWKDFFAKQGVIEATNIPFDNPISISGSGTEMVGGIAGATYSWHVNLDQVYVCEDGVSVQTGFPNGLFDKLAEGAEFGRCEHID